MARIIKKLMTQAELHAERVRNTPTYIFDIDGTLSVPTEERVAFLKDKQDDLRYDKFYAACDTDGRNEPVIAVYEALRATKAKLLFFSGRNSSCRDATVEWLSANLDEDPTGIQSRLSMRPANDRTVDHRLKRRMYDALWPEQREALVATFDDREQVVKMWRSIPVLCFQVAEGKF